MKDIKGFEGKYAVTRDGRVWSHFGKGRFLKLRGSGKKYIRSVNGSIKTIVPREYKTVILSLNGVPSYFYVHRLVAEAFIKKDNNKPYVNHVDGNKSNNHVNNLEWCTHKENISHAQANGLTPRGNKNSQAKLTEADVLKIRDEYSKGCSSQGKIGIKYGMSQGAIHMIVSKKNWNWLKN